MEAIREPPHKALQSKTFYRIISESAVRFAESESKANDKGHKNNYVGFSWFRAYGPYH